MTPAVIYSRVSRKGSLYASTGTDRLTIDINSDDAVHAAVVISLDEARTLAFALLQACHEADPGGDNVETSDEAALTAAQLISEATTELLRYSREGRASPRTVFDDEVCGNLAQALDKALMIEGGPIFDAKTQPDEYADELTKRAVLAQAARFFTEFHKARP